MDIEKITVRITESGKTMDVVVLSKHANRIQVVLGEGVHSVNCELAPTPLPHRFFRQGAGAGNCVRAQPGTSAGGSGSG